MIDHSGDLSTEEKALCTKSIYVDDCILTHDDGPYVSELLLRLRDTLQKNFNLRKLYSSYPLPEHLAEETKIPESILGLQYSQENDHLATCLDPL